MGFHVCEYCQKATSSGDVTLRFDSGRTYQMPDMIVHYILRHHYQPPQQFIDDVMSAELTLNEFYPTSIQTKSMYAETKVGYLKGMYPQGNTPPLFVFALAGMMSFATAQGDRRQTRGM